MKQRICTTLETKTMNKIASIRRQIVSGAYHSGAICRVIDACVEQADEKTVVASLKGTK